MKKTKQITNKLLTFCISVIVLFCMGCEMPETSKSIEENELKEARFTDDFLASASDHKFEGVSIDEIRRLLNDGRQIYQDLRAQSYAEGTIT